MTWKKLLNWLWNHYGELIAAGTSVVDFVSWAAAAIQHLLSQTPGGTVDQVTDEMMEDLKTSWKGPLPPFPPAENTVTIG